MKRWLVLSLLLVPMLAVAADFWDGNAALQRGDADFESGLNVTSNAFPAGTQITILNEDTGKTVTATVTGRIEGQSDILVLLSPKTAQALGVSQGSLGRVRVTVPAGSNSMISRRPTDQTLSNDPDVNPAAGASPELPASQSQPPVQVAQAPTTTDQSTASEQPSATDQADQQPASTDQATSTEQPAATDQATSTEQPAATDQATSTEQQAATDQAAQQQPASTDQATSTEQPAATDQAAQQQTTQQQGTATAQAPAGNPDDAAILSDAKARIPQKQVFQPPREDQKFVYRPKAGTPAASQATAQVAAGGATVTSVDGEPGVKPGPTASASLPLADVAAPEESRPQEVESEAAQAPEASATAQAALPSPDVEQPAAVAGEPVQTEVTAPQTLPPAPGPAPAVALTPPETPAPASATQATQAATTPAATSPASTGTTAAAATTPGSTTPAATVASATAQQGRTAAAVIASVPKTGKGTYYLQLAAFGTEQNARDLATKLGATYPALVVAPASAGATVYRVVIGPLNRAESGTLLLWFRYRGYPDAFLKQE